MNIDELDIKILKENFTKEEISQIDINNVAMIIKYLKDNGIYYANDLFISSLDLFLMPYDDFIKKFEHLKEKVGKDYVEKLGEDASLIEIMYE